MGSISLRDLSKTYGGGAITAVRAVNLEIEDGEFVVFVGPSGCGKSTLLRMIAGLEAISGGTVEIGGKVVNEVAARNRDIAMVFQNYALYPQMTVRQNIAFALELRKFPQVAIDERVNEAARILDLRELLDRKPNQLSGGQRQRVAMGRAIVRHPQAFLLDEPLSNLDAKLRVQLRAELGRLHQRLGVTTIHVTHDQVEAMTLGNRVAVFSRGALQQYDTPQRLYDQPKNIFVAGFIGSPAMNFLEGALSADGAKILVGQAAIPIPTLGNRPAGDRVLVGVRPEHFAWAPAGEGDRPGIEGIVDLVETIEPEAYVTVALSDPAARVWAVDEQAPDALAIATKAAGTVAQRVQIRVQSRTAPALGQKVTLIADAQRVRLFEASSGAAL